jgi:hypothetical protein
MKAQQASLINAITLIAVALYLFYSDLNAQAFNLIPLIFGVILLVLNNGVMYGIASQMKAACFCNVSALVFSGYRFYAAYEMDKEVWMTGMAILFFTSLLATIALCIEILKIKK